ncbi:hypothetical protein ACKGJY_00485 [Hyunsoonleella sp. 2307UL5-6]|uniref:hypothetical protein n=1 Tax=Hyunsoonleella sp. 2307UL5-6 TaxID=3384768 RepID=UPI0039BCA373
MKKLILSISIVLILCINLVYWSTHTTSKTFDTCSLLDGRSMDTIDFRNHDSVLLIPNDLYKSDIVKNLIQGEQYRAAWATPVKFPILFLDTLKGGVNVIEEGGGKQTHSLDVKDENGILYSLRSINKNPKPLIPDVLKILGLENIVVDGISSQHPYGALLAAKLADAVNIYHTNPKAYFLPKQSTLGNYNQKYGNRLFLLEYETEGEINWTLYKNVLELLDTDDLQEFKVKHKDKISIDKAEYIKVRLFDMVIGDWDRHAKQWGWAIEAIDNMYLAHPIAGDRDNAFFDIEGIIPMIASYKHITPKLRPFASDIDFFTGLVYDIDRYFLIGTDIHLFIEQAIEIQRHLTNIKIDEAFMVWPRPISKLHRKEISDKIKSRRDNLIEYAKTFKKTIDKLGVLDVSIKGFEDLNLPEELIKCFDC